MATTQLRGTESGISLSGSPCWSMFDNQPKHAEEGVAQGSLSRSYTSRP